MSKSICTIYGKVDYSGVSDELKLRKITMAAMGDRDQTERLRQNMKLRSDGDLLIRIREKIREVANKHREGSIWLKLDGGKSGMCKDGNGAQWNVHLKEIEYHFIRVRDIVSLRMVISGVELSVESYHYSEGSFAILFENRVRLLGTIKPDELNQLASRETSLPCYITHLMPMNVPFHI